MNINLTKDTCFACGLERNTTPYYNTDTAVAELAPICTSCQNQRLKVTKEKEAWKH